MERALEVEAGPVWQEWTPKRRETKGNGRMYHGIKNIDTNTQDRSRQRENGNGRGGKEPKKNIIKAERKKEIRGGGTN